MARTDEVFESALVGKKVPILTLDNKWHRLFTQKGATPEIKRLEEELNKLIKRQAKANEESKECKKLKKKTMDEIMVLADEMEKNPSKKLEKTMEGHRKLVNECNEKIETCEDELTDLPRQINQANNRLMVATMDVCYRRMQKNTEELEEIEEWIGTIRRELKKKVIRKQEKEAMNHQLYSYMHDIFGADVLEIFDMKYNPEEKYQKGKETDKNKPGAQEQPETDSDMKTEQKEESGNALKS